MRVTIPDELGDAIVAKLQKTQTLDGEVTRLLHLCEHVPATETPLLLHNAQLGELGRVLGRESSLRSFTDILAAVNVLAGLSFGHLRFQFSAGQLAELQRRADRERMSVDEYTARVLRSLCLSFFTSAPAREEWPHREDGLLNLPAPGDDDTVEIV